MARHLAGLKILSTAVRRLHWQCPAASVEEARLAAVEGTVEVTYVSLKSIYSIMDTYKFPLVRSAVQCICDCPGGASHCHNGVNMCTNTTNNCPNR